MKEEYASQFNFRLLLWGLFLVIFFAAICGYFNWLRIYWLAELPNYIILLIFSIWGSWTGIKGKKDRIIVSPIDILVGIFFLYTTGRSVVSFFPHWPADRLVINVITFLFYFILRTHSYQLNNVQWCKIFRLVVYISVFHAIIAIFQACNWLPAYDSSKKMAGLFANPAFLGCFLGIGVCLCVSTILNKETLIIRLKFIYLLCPLLLGLYLSGSRTAWIATLITSATVIIIPFIKKKTRVMKYFIGISVITLILFFSAFTYKLHTDSVTGRLLIWNISCTMLMDSPVFGIGTDRFYSEYGNYQSMYFLSENRPTQEVMTASMNYYAFNEPLKVLVEQGIFGMALLLTLISYCIYCKNKRKNKYDRTVSQSSLSITSLLLIFGLFSYPFHFLIFNLLFILSLSQLTDQRNSFNPKTGESTHKYIRYITIITFLIAGSVSLLKIAAIFTWKTAKEKILTSEGDALKSYNFANQILNNNGSFLYNYGSELIDLGDYKLATKILERAKLYGNSVELHFKMAKISQAIGNTQEAERSLRIACAMNPKLFLPLYKLMSFFEETGQNAKCREIAQIIIDKPVKIHSETIKNIKDNARSYLKKR